MAIDKDKAAEQFRRMLEQLPLSPDEVDERVSKMIEWIEEQEEE